MNERLQEHLNSALSQFTTGDYYQVLKDAKELYFSKTGAVHEEDDDYESRMNAFNDWYLLQFNREEANSTLIKNYLEDEEVEDDLCRTLLDVNFSLFEYMGTNMWKQNVLKDMLHNQKINLAKGEPMPSLVKGDLFIGRVLMLENKFYMMNGVCTLPREIKGILTKECKKVRKKGDVEEEEKFLLQTEYLKTKWRRYGHIDATKIFNYSK